MSTGQHSWSWGSPGTGLLFRNQCLPRSPPEARAALERESLFPTVTFTPERAHLVPGPPQAPSTVPAGRQLGGHSETPHLSPGSTASLPCFLICLSRLLADDLVKRTKQSNTAQEPSTAGIYCLSVVGAKSPRCRRGVSPEASLLGPRQPCPCVPVEPPSAS